MNTKGTNEREVISGEIDKQERPVISGGVDNPDISYEQIDKMLQVKEHGNSGIETFDLESEEFWNNAIAALDARDKQIHGSE